MSYNPQEWKITDDYSIKFKSKDPSGIFKDFKGDINYDANDLANSKFDVSIDVSSISTGNGMMNKKHKQKNGLTQRNILKLNTLPQKLINQIKELLYLVI